MTTTLLFVRHGSTLWTTPPSRYQGRTDLPLSVRGREGKRHAEVEEHHAEALTAWAAGMSSPPGGESRLSLMQRVSGFLDDVAGQGTVAVVTHKEVIRAGAITLACSIRRTTSVSTSPAPASSPRSASPVRGSASRISPVS
jgi:broad specificity phosphatase PhoE